MGARLLAEWLTSPLTSPELIAERLDAVEELLNESALRGDIRSLLGESYDLERLAARVGTGRATPARPGGPGRTLAILPKLKARLDGPDLDPAEPARGRTRALPRGPRRDRGRALTTTRPWPSRKAA